MSGKIHLASAGETLLGPLLLQPKVVTVLWHLLLLRLHRLLLLPPHLPLRPQLHPRPHPVLQRRLHPHLQPPPR